MQKTAKEAALKLKQAMGWTSFDCPECNATTLPESVATKCALIDIQNQIDLVKELSESFGHLVNFQPKIDELTEIKTELEKL